MGLGKCFAASPGNEVVHGTPPGFDFVVAFTLGVFNKSALFVIEPHRSWPVDLVANEPGGLVNEMDPVAEAVFKINFMTLRYGNAIGDDDHR
jgi:hypothetical protein